MTVELISGAKGVGFLVDDEREGDPQFVSTITPEQIATISDPGQKALAEFVTSVNSFSHSVWSQIPTANEELSGRG